jgi:hypothetical protein
MRKILRKNNEYDKEIYWLQSLPSLYLKLNCKRIVSTWFSWLRSPKTTGTILKGKKKKGKTWKKGGGGVEEILYINYNKHK